MAITADSVVVDLIANTGQHDASVMRSASVFEDASRRSLRAANEIERAAQRTGYAQRNIGRQIDDIGAQVAGGQSPFLIIAQQAPQVADALADVQSKAGRVAAFFAGPWGAALLAAASVVGVLVSNLDESSRASDGAGKGHEFVKLTVDQLITAIDDLAESQAQENKTKVDALRESKAYAAYLYVQADAIRTVTRATLEGAIAEQAARKVRAQAIGPRGDIAALGLEGGDSTIAFLQSQLAKLDAGVMTARQSYRAATANLVEFAASSDAAAKATQRFEQSVKSLKEQYASGVIKTQSELNRKIAEATTLRDRETAAIKRQRDTSSRGRSSSGGRVETAAQRFERQQREDDAEERRRSVSINDILNRPGGISDRVNADNERIVKEFNGKLDTERKLQAYREDNVRSLASLYESAFTDGARGIGRALESALISAIAKALAEKTVDSFGSFATSLTSAFGFGRASGGYVAPGQMVRVNEGSAPGRVEGFRPLGAGHIVPLGRMNAQPARGGVTVLQTVAVDARGAVMNDQFAEMILARSGEQAVLAAQFAASAGAAPFASATRPRLPGT